MTCVAGSRICWVLIALASACASGQAPASRPDPAGRRHLPDDVGELVWSALYRDDIDPVHSRFDATLAWSLPPARLRQLWNAVAVPRGGLRAWRLTDQSFRRGRARLEYDLEFDAGRGEGVLAINPDDLTVAALDITPTDRAAPGEPSPLTKIDPAATTAVAGVQAESIRFGQPPWTLEGVITRPDRRGTFPAAVLVAGAGPLDRDATVGANRPFRDIAEGLSRQGMVVLRYDKRTFTHALHVDPSTLTVEQEVILDAVAALAVLRSRPEVRRDAVFVIGHGLGGQLAPEIAQRDGKTAGLVLLAPPARPAPVMAIQQLRLANGIPPEALAALEKKAAAIVAGSARPDETFLGAPASYFIDLQKRDGMAAARALGRPTLLLRGGLDQQITDDDFQRWRRALDGRPGVSAAVLEGLDNLFMPAQETRKPAEYLLPATVSLDLHDRIRAFVTACLGGVPDPVQ